MSRVSPTTMLLRAVLAILSTRFTIFFKKGEQVEQNQYVVENTVSLNADFLKFLVDKRHMQSMKANSMTRGRQS